MTQYDLERRYAAWWRAGAEAAQAGTAGDWALELDGDRLVLSPVAQRWFFFDAAHDEWLDTGIVPGEAVFVSIAGVLGAKRGLAPAEVTLPIEERVERIVERVVAALDGELMGPMRLAEAQALASARPGSSLHVWSTRHPEWLEAVAAAPR
jgi:hypothetical protein